MDDDVVWQTCHRCGKPVHINWVDYEPDPSKPDGVDYDKPFHADGCATD